MKHVMASFLWIALCGISLNAWSVSQIDLKTPRGSLIKVDLYNLKSPKVLVAAPGRGCGPRMDLYDALAGEAKDNGFALVRLYWAYCVADPQNGAPSQDLSREIEDFLTALSYVKNTLGFSDSSISIGGKSLGSFVSYEVFQTRKTLPQLLLLTPVCTDASNPKELKNVFSEYYPKLASETRPVLLVQGIADPYCDAHHFQDYLQGKPNNFISLVTKGDHGLGIKDSSGQYNAKLGAKNLRAISRWIFSWL